MTWDRPLEKDIEAYLVKRAKQAGWVAYKFVAPGRRSVPDRLVLKDNGTVFFVEVKRPGGKPTPLQEAEHAALRSLGFTVYTVDNRESVDAVVEGEV